MFYTCLSVHSGGVPGQVHPLGRYSPEAVTPPGQVLSPGQLHPPGQVLSPGQLHPLGRYTPRQVHPPPGTSLTTVHAGIRSTSGQCASHWNAFLLCQKLIKTFHELITVYSKNLFYIENYDRVRVHGSSTSLRPRGLPRTFRGHNRFVNPSVGTWSTLHLSPDCV